MNFVRHQPLNHQNIQLCQTPIPHKTHNMTPESNWKYQDNPYYAKVGKSPYAPLYGHGPGYSAGKNKQGITAGAGTVPLEGGMREDGRLVSPQGTSHNLNSHTDIVNKGYMMTSRAHNNSGGAVWNGTMRHKYRNNDWNNHILQSDIHENFTADMFDPGLSGINGRSWKNTYNGVAGYNPIQDDDSPAALEAGPADLSSDTNIGNNPSIPQYKNQGNNSYNVTSQAHPTDIIGSAINMLSNVAKGNMVKPNKTNHNNHPAKHHPNHHEKQKNDPDGDSKIEKEIEMIEQKNDKCLNPDYSYHKTTSNFPGQYCTKEDIDFGKSIESKDFCYIDETVPPSLVKYYGSIGVKACSVQPTPAVIPTPTPSTQGSYDRVSNKIKARMNVTDDKRKYYDSKVSEDKRNYQSDLTLDRNQLMVDNNRTPININMSCNQGGRRGYQDEYGHYSGYGTPNLYNECVYNNRRGCYSDTLNNWYNDMSANNNVYRRRRQWQDRDYYREGYGRPNYSSSRYNSRNNSMSNSEIGRTVIGAPYATYTPYSKVNQANQGNYVDKARDVFNETQT